MHIVCDCQVISSLIFLIPKIVKAYLIKVEWYFAKAEVLSEGRKTKLLRQYILIGEW